MRRNRFEKVDEVQDDAITLELAADGDPEKSRVHVPGAEGGEARVSEPAGSQDAFRNAVKLANTMKLAIVVMGDESAWDPVWGDLYRPV
ncbi:MAG: hypothetical protein AAGF49_00650 [Pseudomonadota bacterium]